jgi:hypothetical protein
VPAIVVPGLADDVSLKTAFPFTSGPQAILRSGGRGVGVTVAVAVLVGVDVDVLVGVSVGVGVAVAVLITLLKPSTVLPAAPVRVT